MVTFTVAQIHDALDNIMRDIADHMRKETAIDLTDEGNCRQYTIAELKDAGWDNCDIVRLVWADPRTPFEARKALQDEKKRLDHDKAFSPLTAPATGPNSKIGRLVDFFEKQLDAYNQKGTAEAAE